MMMDECMLMSDVKSDIVFEVGGVERRGADGGPGNQRSKVVE